MISIDAEARTADVQGMCTYEHLVDATLPHGLIPYVVPQLRTITLGGAVSGLGIESTCFRNGLPARVGRRDGHLHRRRRGRHARGPVTTCSTTFPNSYGSLGYATRLRIELEQVPAYVALRHVRFDDAGAPRQDRHAGSSRPGSTTASASTGSTARSFEPGEYYLTLAEWTEATAPLARREQPSDYTGQQIYYRSIQQRETDLLTMYDYLWRWDTDWFWCSRAFGAQHPVVRRVWPRRWKRSDVYYQMVGLDHRLHVGAWLDRREGNPEGERVVQDVEIPVDRLPRVPRLVRRRGRDASGLAVPADRAARSGPPTRWRRTRSTSTSASGATSRSVPTRRTRPATVRSRRRSTSSAATSRSTPRRSTTRRRSTSLYDGANLAQVKGRYDPDEPADHPLRQGGEETMTMRIADAFEQLIQGPLPLRFTAYDGSASGPEDAPFGFELRNERGLPTS